jgi:hypothetical protein
MDVQNGGRQILLHGLVLILVGLVWGLAVPHTPFPRLALGAHIQFVTNGLLLIAMGSLLRLFQPRIAPWAVWIMVLAAWLVWLMALSEMANAWWGTVQVLPIAAGQAGATGGEPWQEMVVLGAHISAGLALIAAWGLLVVGFVRGE